MRPSDRPKFSTPPFESLWWRADITKDDVRWVRRHLGHSLDGLREFKANRKPLYCSNGPIGDDWSSRVEFVEGEAAPHVQIALADKYDYRAESELSRNKGEAHLGPHGLFRDLKNGFHEHAMLFMQQFGPLTWEITTGRRGEEGWVNLSDFWDRHMRFVAVAQLWESRFDEAALKQNWRWAYERLDRINRVGPAHFGAAPNWNLDKYYEFPVVVPFDFHRPMPSLPDALDLRHGKQTIADRQRIPTPSYRRVRTLQCPVQIEQT